MLSRTKYKYNIVKDNQNHEHIYFPKLRTWNISLTTYYYSTHSADFTRSPWPCDFADSHSLSRRWADSLRKIKFVCGGNAEKVKSAFCWLYSITHSFIKSINHIYYHQLRTANILNILKFIYTWTFCSLYIYITLNGVWGCFATILCAKRQAKRLEANRLYTVLTWYRRKYRKGSSSHFTYFSVWQMQGSSHLAQKLVAEAEKKQLNQ